MCDLMVLVQTTIWAAISPVDAVEVLTVAVAELYGELRLANSTGAGEGGGLDDGWSHYWADQRTLKGILYALKTGCAW